jgi:hypothetical protein
MLIAGLLLTAVGLAYEPQQPQNPPASTAVPMPPPTAPVLGNADSNGRMIAVTGVDLTGSSILYVIDTEAKQIAVYQAQGGGSSTQSIKLVGARRIDLDLQLYGYNDESEYKYEDLEKKFIESGILGADDR